MKECLDLLWTFIVIGATTFGGGYAMIPVLERELIKKRRWITMDEVLDYYTIAQITPGIIAVNTATFVGYRRKGILGGILATIGLVLPGVSLMIIISLFINRFAEYPVVQHAFTGIRIAVCSLILDAVLKLFKNIYKNYKSIIICVIAFALSAVFSASPVYIIAGAGIAGFLLFSPKQTAAGTKPESGEENTDPEGDDKP
ncbi:MAG: chromate transporter [Treponema sp.]|nr:chromate transporter [Treponema sp.]